MVVINVRLCAKKKGMKEKVMASKEETFFVFFRLSGSSFMSFKSYSIQMKTSSLEVKPAPMPLCYVAFVFQSSSFTYEIKEAGGIQGMSFYSINILGSFFKHNFSDHIFLMMNYI